MNIAKVQARITWCRKQSASYTEEADKLQSALDEYAANTEKAKAHALGRALLANHPEIVNELTATLTSQSDRRLFGLPQLEESGKSRR
jgi:hypothetical protein